MDTHQLSLHDPSIISFSEDLVLNATVADKGKSELLGNLSPTNVLSKLLDSAMANAAKESTPDFEQSGENSTCSNEPKPIDEGKFDLPSSSSNSKYSIEFLLSLRHSKNIPNFDGKLPDKSFWYKSKNEFPNQTTGKHRKSSFTKKNHAQDHWEKKSTPVGFVKQNDLDSLSSEKISRLLGEPFDEGQPEWDSADIKNVGMADLSSMGQTVEDFEKWKSLMKMEERRKNNEPLDEELEDDFAAEKAGNDVDSFFSFAKPRSTEGSVRSSSISSTTNKTPNITKTETTGRSSKFSSFFAPSPKATEPQNQEQPVHRAEPQVQIPLPPQLQQQPKPNHNGMPQFQEPPRRDQPPPGFSRFFNEPMEKNSSIKAPNPPPGFIPDRNDNPQVPATSNDSFFMSLMSKKEQPSNDPAGSGRNAPDANAKSGMQALFTANPQPFMSPNQENGAKPQEGSQQKLSPQQPNGPSQQQRQQLPPWMKQFQNGMPMPPPGMQYPQNFQGQNFRGQLGANGPPNSHQGMPPPGMYPNGMMPNGMPPPHQRMPPPQFVNGTPNPPYPPPQFMGVPPGMPPPMQNQYMQQQAMQQGNQRPPPPQK